MGFDAYEPLLDALRDISNTCQIAVGERGRILGEKQRQREEDEYLIKKLDRIVEANPELAPRVVNDLEDILWAPPRHATKDTPKQTAKESLAHDLVKLAYCTLEWFWEAWDKAGRLLERIPEAALQDLHKAGGKPWDWTTRRVLDAIAEPVVILRPWVDKHVFAGPEYTCFVCTPEGFAGQFKEWPALVELLDEQIHLFLQIRFNYYGAQPQPDNAQPAGAGQDGARVSKDKRVKAKRSEAPGGARAKLIAALTKHHKYAAGSCLNTEFIGSNGLCRLAKVSQGSGTLFFQREFSGHTAYKRLCARPGELAQALRLLNGEVTPRILLQREVADPSGDDDE